MSCDRIEQVHAFYDGELSLSQRGEFEAHLNDCAECRDLLADLRRVSDLLASAPLAELPAGAMTKFQQTWFAAAQDRGVMRIASWLTSAAAAILIGALLIWPSNIRQESTIALTASPELAAAVTPPAGLQENDSADLVVAAQWMANDLTPDPAR
jgi:anti-sigma factor RsiW